MGFRGLALGTAIAANVNAGLLIFFLARRLDGVDGTRILRAFGKMLLASALMGVAAWGVSTWLTTVWPHAGFWARLVRVSGAIGTGIAVLAMAAHFLHIDEFRVAMRRLLARLKIGAG